jgi:hypothetical protein
MGPLERRICAGRLDQAQPVLGQDLGVAPGPHKATEFDLRRQVSYLTIV